MPLLFDSPVVCTLVSTLAAVTLAPAITAPEESVMVPFILPVMVCATRATLNESSMAIAISRTSLEQQYTVLLLVYGRANVVALCTFKPDVNRFCGRDEAEV